MNKFRIGLGYDVHRLVQGRKLILGGIEIPYEKGCLGHSDADVLVHAICDALLGSLAMGDIGKHFPDTDPKWKDISSMRLLEIVIQMIRDKGFDVVNIDANIALQQPKIADFLPAMSLNIAELLGIDQNQVSVKATTTEHLGFEGRGEGISVQSVCLVSKV